MHLQVFLILFICFFFSATNAEFFQGYGLTETSPIATLAPKILDNCATIGWPISSTEMKIVSLDEHSSLDGLGPNEDGELLGTSEVETQ